MVTVEVPVNAPSGNVISTLPSAVVIVPPDAGIALVAFVPLGVVVGVGAVVGVAVGAVVGVGVGTAVGVGVAIGAVGVIPTPNSTTVESDVFVPSLARACTWYEEPLPHVGKEV
jgi:hypothetical protein